MDFVIDTPFEFDFDLCMGFLQRSPRELLHRWDNGRVRKLIQLGEQPVLFELGNDESRNGDTKVGNASKRIRVKVLNTALDVSGRALLEQYIRAWFDLDTDLKPFYAKVANDKL